ncbi:MAG: hypothetical protein ACXVCR_01330 [Bdellovibrio sp.]
MSPFFLAPNLSFESENPNFGSVEAISLTEIPSFLNLSSSEIASIGSLLALSFWFGLGDLHIENIMVGFKDDQLVCFPIDIECIFDYLTHLKQTLIVPSERISQEKCGLAKLWPILLNLSKNSKLEIIRTFTNGINIFNQMAEEILSIINKCDGFQNHPIRTVVRDTDYYNTVLKSRDFGNLYQSEIEQLNRGDIPYYFRYPLDLNIYYWTTNEKFEKADFGLEEFNIPSPVEISENNAHKFLKIKTAILSVNHLANQLGLISSLIQLNCVNVLCENRNWVFEESNSKIFISGS